MEVEEALGLLQAAIPAAAGGNWADLGAGDGTFTLALAEMLGPDARIFAVDGDADALASLKQRATSSRATITAVVADFTVEFEPPAANTLRLDGILFANSLHFVEDQARVLRRLLQWLAPRGRVVFVEYDRRPASRWVPFPIDAARLPALCRAVGLGEPTVTARRPSDYGGDMYVAWATLASGKGLG
jgi:SAM-dependent methyltransferase